jgi:hypothetical protein
MALGVSVRASVILRVHQPAKRQPVHGSRQGIRSTSQEVLRVAREAIDRMGQRRVVYND